MLFSERFRLQAKARPRMNDPSPSRFFGRCYAKNCVQMQYLGSRRLSRRCSGRPNDWHRLAAVERGFGVDELPDLELDCPCPADVPHTCGSHRRYASVQPSSALRDRGRSLRPSSCRSRPRRAGNSLRSVPAIPGSSQQSRGRALVPEREVRSRRIDRLHRLRRPCTRVVRRARLDPRRTVLHAAPLPAEFVMLLCIPR